MIDFEDDEYNQRISFVNCGNGGNNHFSVKSEPLDADLGDLTEIKPSIKLETETVDNETQFKADFKLKLEPYNPLFTGCDNFKVSLSPFHSCREFNEFDQTPGIPIIKTEGDPLEFAGDEPLPNVKTGTLTHSTTLFPRVEGTVLMKENCCLAPKLVLVKLPDLLPSSVSKDESKNVSIDDPPKNYCTENFNKHAHSIDSVDGMNFYKCKICEKSFKLKKSLHHHKCAEHSTEFQEEYTCNHCERTNTSKSSLRRHIVMFHSVENNFEYTCDLCKKVYASKMAVRNHIYCSHVARQREWICKICCCVFTDPSNLNRHLRNTHQKLPKRFRKPLSTVKPQCEVCGGSFATNSSKKLHFKRFHIDNPQPNISKQRYLLNPNMQPNMSKQRYLQNQKLLALNIPLNECKICGALFKDKCHLNRHRETHARIKYNCHLCGQKYSDKSSLRRHTRRVHTETE